jgi:F-type H+-transporting ATPase subunit b
MVYNRGLGKGRIQIGPAAAIPGPIHAMEINLVPDLSLLAVLAIFIATYIVVSRFFVRPVVAVIESREHETRGALEVYEAAMARFNEATAKMEERLHIAKREAGEVRERFRAAAAEHRAALVARTNAEAETMVSEAETQLSRDVAVAREKIVHDSESLARLAAERILGRPV